MPMPGALPREMQSSPVPTSGNRRHSMTKHMAWMPSRPSKDKVPSDGVLPLFLKHPLLSSTPPFSYPMRQQGLDTLYKTHRIQQPHPSITTSLDLAPPSTDYSTTVAHSQLVPWHQLCTCLPLQLQPPHPPLVL